MLTKNEAEAIMKDMPVTLPYRDWDSLRSMPATIRHTLATNVLSENTEGIDEIRALDIDVENHLPAFPVARWMARDRFIQWLDAAMAEKQTRSAPEFFADLDFNTSIITRMRKKQRPFCIPISSLEAVCNMMNLSAHELLFGEPGVLDLSVLPSFNRLVVELESLDKKDLLPLLAEAKLVAEQYKKEALDLGKGESGHCTNANSLFVRRISWYTRENGLRPIQAFGRTLDSTPHRIHSSMYQILGDRQYEAKLPVLMEAALSCNMALDFFVKDNPVTMVDIVVLDKDGRTVKITSPELIDFLSCVFVLEDDQRVALLKQAWRLVYTTITK